MIDYAEINQWVPICEIRENELCFTKQFIEATKILGGARRKFVSHLVGGWDKSFERLLEYFGPDDAERDWYSGIDGEAMDVCEMIPEYLEHKGQPINGLSSDWFRDIMRINLVNLKLPRTLIDEYIKLFLENIKR